MRLLEHNEIRELLADPDSDLQIEGFRSANLQHTSYYVSLGDEAFRRSDGLVDEPIHIGSPFLNFDPFETIRVSSAERFRLGGKLLGILGGLTNTPMQGFQLLSGTFVDPLFPGIADTACLEFSIVNLNSGKASFRRGDPIAKLCLFDISDSREVTILPGSFESVRTRSAPIRPSTTTLRKV